MEQLIILLIVGFVALVKWLAKNNAGSETPSAPPARPQTMRPQIEETEDERMRKFFDALGIPQTTTPPPKVAPPRAKPASPLVAPRPVADLGFPKQRMPLPRAQEPPPVPRTLAQKSPPVISTMPDELARAAVFSESSKPGLEPATAINVRAMLKSPDNLRAAIILREILGPPGGLQSY